MKRCSYCKKPLEGTDYITVQQHGKNTYFCPEHKGFKRNDQFFWTLILEIMDEPVLNHEIYDRLTPILRNYDPGRVSHFFYDKKEYYKELFSEKVDNHYKDLNHKINLMARVLRNDFPRYHFYEDKEEIAVNGSRYEPIYDSSLKSAVNPNFQPRETIQQKKDRLLKEMEQTPVSVNSKYTSLFGYILDNDN